MNNLEIRVNVVGQIKLFRSSMFPEKLPFIEEAFQNAQRAKATLVEVWVKDDEIVIMDDGIGLNNPEDLFTIAQSGWDEETVKEQKPFGLGFFSCVTMADIIIIESGYTKCVFDVPEIVQTNKARVRVEQLQEYVSGFRVILRDLLPGVKIFNVERRVREVASYISQFDVELNGVRLQKLDLNKPDTDRFFRKIEEPNCRGWIRAYDWIHDRSSLFNYESGVKIFHQERYVKDLNILGNEVVGVISVDNLDLRAPDRKEIIQNEKLEELKGLLKREVKALFKEVIATGSEKELERFENSLCKELYVEEYQELLRFLILKGDLDLERIRGKTKEQLERMSSEEILELLGANEDTQEDTQEMIPSEYDLSSKREPLEIASRMVDRAEIPDLPPGEKLPPMDDQLKYYLRKDEIIDYVDRIRRALDNGIPVILIRNRLEITAIMSREDILHISELDQREEWNAKINNPGPADQVEGRAEWLFEVISRIMGLEESPFIIGDVEATKVVTFGPIEVSREDIVPFGMCNGRVILIDRSKLAKDSLKPSTFKRLLASDLLFIGRNLDTIAHELTHLLYKTEDGTPAHYRLQLDVTRHLTERLFSGKLNI